MQDEFGYLPPETSRLPEEPALRETFSMVPELAVLPPEICFSDENGIGSDKKRKSKEEKGKQKSLLIKMLSGVLIAGNLVGASGHENLRPEPTKVYAFETGGTAVLGDTATMIELTRWEEQSIGGIWCLEPINPDEQLVIDFDMKLSDTRISETDYAAGGLAVSFSDTPDCSELHPGGELGYKGLMGVEFDLFTNPVDEMAGEMDYDSGHIAILEQSVWSHVAVSDTLPLENVGWKHVQIVYEKDMLRVFYDEQMVVDADISNLVEFPDGIYLSLTATTGNQNIYQAVDHVKINDAEIEIVLGDHITYEKPCALCFGAGFICPGSIEANDPEGCHGDLYVRCRACNNTGYEQDGRLCSWCKGTLVHLCGSFEKHYPCEMCGGTGKLIAGYVENEENKGTP